MSLFRKSHLAAFLIATSLVLAGPVRAADTTYVRFNTTLGNIDVQLLTDEKPITTGNFLGYLDSGSYYGSVVHRSVNGPQYHIIQGGTYNLRSNNLSAITVNAPILNEAGISNIRGTLAMAYVDPDPNSATSGWFFNTQDNSGVFDVKNYTVFGRVANPSSLAVMDALQIVPVPFPSPLGSPFDQIPLNNYSAPNVLISNLIMVNSVTRESEPVPATITLGDLQANFNGAQQGVSYTTNPPGLGANIIYNGAGTLAPTGTGIYSVSAYITSPGYTGITTGQFQILGSAAKTASKITLTAASLKATYNGNAHIAAATTTPAGLPVTFTYNGESSPPTAGGSYAVVATINDPTHSGTARGTLVIGKVPATVSVTNGSFVYTGGTQSPVATTNPPGLPVSFTYGGKATTAINAGTYKVTATISDPSYSGTGAGTLTITKAAATVTLGGLTAYYNGLAKNATATTNPANIPVTFTYNGKATVPVAPGSYTVVGTVNSPNFTGSATGTMTISTAPPVVLLGATDAELTAGVNPNGVLTGAYFEFGLTTAYGFQTSIFNAGKGSLPVNLISQLTNLQPNTLYHYRFNIVTAAGTVLGPDQTFTTLGFETTETVGIGLTAPGTGNAMYSVIGNPIINNGDHVAFLGTLKLATGVVTAANNTGIWAEDGAGTLQKIIQLGDVAPGTLNATYSKLGDPVYNNSEQVAYIGTLKAVTGQATATTATGIWSTTTGSLALVARQGSPAPGTSGGTFASFTSLGLADANGVIFLATLNASKTPAITATNNMGIWQGADANGLHLVVRLGDTISGKKITKFTFLPTPTYVNGQTRGFSSTNGNCVFGATFSDKTTGVVRILAGVPTIVAVSGGIVTGGIKFASFANPAINAGNNTAFLSTLTTGSGINTTNNLLVCADDVFGNRNFISESGDFAPGTLATFIGYSDPVYNNSNAVAFRATIKGTGATTANSVGIWCDTSGALDLIARQGFQAPGCSPGATFATFTELTLPDQGGPNNNGGVVFLATLNASAPVGVSTSNNTGIWAVDNSGAVQLIVRTGDIVDIGGTVKTITGISFLANAAGVNGQGRSVDQSTGDLVYLATFSDKTTSIIKVFFP